MANSDYRLGNWIILHGKTCQITGILKGYLNVNDECYEDDKGEFQPVWYGNGGVEPIPLTYDILVNHGFIDPAKNGWGCRISVSSSDEICFYVQDSSLRYQTKLSGFTRNYNAQYFHQVQNLFHYLTGDELKQKALQPA